MFKMIKSFLEKTEYSVQITEEGFHIISGFGLKHTQICWADIKSIWAVRYFPANLKLVIQYQKNGHHRHLFVFDDIPIWNEIVKKLCDKLPMFNVKAIEDAHEDIYEQIHICWTKDSEK